MTTQIKKPGMLIKILLLIIAALSAACSQAEKPEVSSNLSLNENLIRIEFKNAGKEPVSVDTNMVISGMDGGGNMLLLPISKDGVIYRICSYVDAGDVSKKITRLDPGATSLKVISSVPLAKRIYCLPSGDFYVSALYFDKNGSRFHSNTIKIRF